MQRAGCTAANAVSRPPEALSMTERSAGRNGSDRSSRLCGVLARIVSLTRHSPADKSVIRSGRRRSGTAYRHRGPGRAIRLCRNKRITIEMAKRVSASFVVVAIHGNHLDLNNHVFNGINQPMLTGDSAGPYFFTLLIFQDLDSASPCARMFLEFLK